jgi:competence protein ComEC
MRGAVLYLIAVTALIGCGDTHKASGPEATSGGEIVARRAVGSTTTALTQNSLEIYVIDVGQGDSTLIVGPGPDEERFTMLIDAGNYTSGSNGAAFVRPILDFADVTYLDVVIATHFDADHIGGFVTSGSGDSLLWTYEEDEDGELVCEDTSLFPWASIANPGPNSTDPSNVEAEWHECVEDLTNKYGLQLIVVDGPDDIETQWDLGGGYTATIVAGGGYVLGKDEKVRYANSKNEHSIAVLVSNAQGFDFLVTGDLIGQSAGTENAKLEGPLGHELQNRGIDVEVLRTGHHGAANATKKEFVEFIDPVVAIISVGNNNNHEHPRVRTHRTLDQVGVPWILQTEKGHPNEAHNFQTSEQIVVNGTIHIRVTGNTYTIKSVGEESVHGGQPTETLNLVCDEDGCAEGS